jgi:hypothetical protein
MVLDIAPDQMGCTRTCRDCTRISQIDLFHGGFEVFLDVRHGSSKAFTYLAPVGERLRLRLLAGRARPSADARWSARRSPKSPCDGARRVLPSSPCDSPGAASNTQGDVQINGRLWLCSERLGSARDRKARVCQSAEYQVVGGTDGFGMTNDVAALSAPICCTGHYTACTPRAKVAGCERVLLRANFIPPLSHLRRLTPRGVRFQRRRPTRRRRGLSLRNSYFSMRWVSVRLLMSSSAVAWVCFQSVFL